MGTLSLLNQFLLLSNNMKLFCSYAFTGEDSALVEKRMHLVVNALNRGGHTAYCPFFDLQEMGLQGTDNFKAIFAHAFRHIAQNEGLVAIITSPKRSEGQLMEIGAALSRDMPFYLFIHSSAETTPSHLPKLATQTFVWHSDEELERLLQAAIVQ